MTKTDLVNVVAAETEVSKKTVDTVVNSVLDAIANALKENDKVQLIGFGTFEVKTVAARDGHNPKTGEAIQIPEGKKSVAYTFTLRSDSGTLSEKQCTKAVSRAIDELKKLGAEIRS